VQLAHRRCAPLGDELVLRAACGGPVAGLLRAWLRRESRGMAPASRLLFALLLLSASAGPGSGSAHEGQRLREMYQDAQLRHQGGAERLRELLEQPPYLSVVLVMRNDDYGGNLLHRFERAISDLAEAGLRHGLRYELIVIEWNPPAGRQCLREAVRWPEALVDVRVVTVPEEVHTEAACRGWEYEAKNLGVSLAHGKVGAFRVKLQGDLCCRAGMLTQWECFTSSCSRRTPTSSCQRRSSNSLPSRD